MCNATKKNSQKIKTFNSPHVQLRCCASLFSHAMCVLVRRCRRIPSPACSQIRCYRSSHPIPIRRTWCPKTREETRNRKFGSMRHENGAVINSLFLPIVSHPRPIRTCSPAAARSGGSSRMCTTRWTPRCTLEQSSASPLHSWWHKWRPSHGNLSRRERKN